MHARQTYSHARLEDAVPRADALFVFVIQGTIQRVRHGSDKLTGRIARQLCIGIKCDYILHVRQDFGGADHG